LTLLGVAFPSFLIHGGIGLDHIRGQARAPAKPCESGVYDGGAACNFPCARGSRIPYSGGGYIMVWVVFYEPGFGMPSHQFLHSLLQFYGLELHHLIPSGILHMEAFVTLCEAYMRIEPNFNLWHYFFHAPL
jgi:hypothetical protein